MFRKAAELLTESHRVDEAIDLLVNEREYEAAAQLAESLRDWGRAAKLWFRAGRFQLAAKAHMKDGDDEAAVALLENGGHLQDAAQLRESRGELRQAADLYERGGDRENAARVLALTLRTAPSQRTPAAEREFVATCRRAAHLFAGVGQLDRAVKMLKWAGQDVMSAEILAEYGHLAEAIEMMRGLGMFEGAIELARRANESRLVALLTGQLAEKQGDVGRAIACYEEAGDFPEAARLWAISGDSRRAAAAYERAGRLDDAAAFYLKAGMNEDAARCLQLGGRSHHEVALARVGSVALGDPLRHVSANDPIGRAIAVVEIGVEHPDYRDAVRLLMNLPPDSPDYVRAQMALDDSPGARTKTPPRPSIDERVVAGDVASQLGAARPSQELSFALPNPPPPLFEPVINSTRGGEGSNPGSQTKGSASSVERSRPGLLVGKPSEGISGQDGTASADGAPQTVAQSLAGLVLRGRFRIEKRVGGGAQAQVYLAKDVVLDRAVAIKVLNDAVARDAVATERFLREARFAARVTHPNSIGVFDFGHDGGLTFMAMEYFAGETLRAHLKVNQPPLRDLLRIAIDVGEALRATHEQGIIHRDVKPSNVMIDGRGQIRLADFGIARNAGEEPPSEKGIMMGSLAYMAPEQATGGKLDFRADIFAFGVVLFEMTTRRKPFGPSMEALKRRLDRQPPEVPSNAAIPPRLAAMMDKCMQPSRDERFASMDEVLRELRAIAESLAAGVGASSAVEALEPVAPELASGGVRTPHPPLAASAAPPLEQAAEAVDFADLVDLAEGERTPDDSEDPTGAWKTELPDGSEQLLGPVGMRGQDVPDHVTTELGHEAEMAEAAVALAHRVSTPGAGSEDSAQLEPPADVDEEDQTLGTFDAAAPPMLEPGPVTDSIHLGDAPDVSAPVALSGDEDLGGDVEPLSVSTDGSGFGGLEESVSGLPRDTDDLNSPDAMEQETDHRAIVSTVQNASPVPRAETDDEDAPRT